MISTSRLCPALAVALAAVAAACGGEHDDRSDNASLASRSGGAQLPRAPTQLVGVDDGIHILALHRADERPDCYDREWGPFADPDSWVEFGAEACMGDRAWHVLVGTGGGPGSVDWAIVVGVTRPNVARISVTTASGTVHEEQTRPVDEADEHVFSLRLEEEVRTLQAYAADGKLIETQSIRPLLRRECDWICRGEGDWATLVDPHRDFVAQSPEVEWLAADDRLRDLFAGSGFDLFGHDDWHGCAGIAHGTTWSFIPDHADRVAWPEWPTLDGRGTPIVLRSPDPPDVVTVDIDLDAKRIVSILPYYASEGLGPPRSEWRRAPLYSDDCRMR